MVRLKRALRDDLTVRRVRRGRGWSYVDRDGNVIRDPELYARARALGIPPAWKDVRIAPDPRHHIQALGTDAAGRMQYIYHPDWEARRTRRKQQQLALLSEALPRIRRRVRDDLEAEPGSKRLALALGVALIDRTAMRVGRERYLEAHGTRGAGTLFSRDVAVKGGTVRIRFPAKSGKTADYVITDERLADAVRKVKAIPGARLLMYRNGDGQPKAIRTDDLMRYLREIAGAPVTAKDFRTLHASALAAEAMAKLQPAAPVSGRTRRTGGGARQVATFLQNTPAICRASYVAPCLYTLFDKGRLAELWVASGTEAHGLRKREARLTSILASAG
jgi:DNA topoisomerase-1